MRQVLMCAMVAAAPARVLAQEAAAAPTRLEASYVVRRDGKDVGRERLVVSPGQISQGRAGMRWELQSRLLSGDEIRAVLTQSSDGMLDALQLETRDAEGTKVLRAAHRGTRIVISLTGDRIRRARELPAAEHSVLLDEQLHGLLFVVKDLASDAGTALVGIYPRTGDRVNFTAKREAGAQGGMVIVLTGGLTGRLTIDADGRVNRMDLTSAKLVLERLPG
ncbi:MAG TPA: hypothetical protein VFX50_13760 [Gemmatimonadales bacterium]|nr:hypothetical protein [Gemmatimonadales bacterium]